MPSVVADVCSARQLEDCVLASSVSTNSTSNDMRSLRHPENEHLAQEQA